MEYQGNPSLPKETRERILGTFKQTLDSAQQGSVQEAMLGCDFIQRLDPQFRPAQILAERLQQGGPVETADLVAGAAAAPTPAPAAAPAPAPAAAPAVDPNKLRAALQKLQADGDLDKLLQLARKYQATVMQHQDMQELVQAVQMRQQTAQYVEGFLRGAAGALDRGELDVAAEELKKAQGLDPQNPRVAQMLQAHAQAVAAQQAAAQQAAAQQAAAQQAAQQAAAPADQGFDLESLDFGSLEEPASEEVPGAGEPLGTVKMQPPAAAEPTAAAPVDQGGFDFSLADLGEPAADSLETPAAEAGAGFDLGGGGFELGAEELGSEELGADELGAADLSFEPPPSASPPDVGGFELPTEPVPPAAPAATPAAPATAGPDAGFDLGDGFDLGTPEAASAPGGFDLGSEDAGGGFDLPSPEPTSEPPALPVEELSPEPAAAEAAAEPATVPAAPVPAAPASEPIPPSGDSRIDDLLREGQEAFEQRDYQGAIDAWSRIFLIDLDNEEASTRIDKARQLKAESERQVEEVFQEGMEALRAQDADAAKQAFEQVLAAQPGNNEARDFLEQLEAGQMPEVDEQGNTTDTIEAAAEHMLAKEIMVPPEPGEESTPRGPAEKRQVAVGGASARRRFLLIGGLVLALVLGGGWYVFTHRDDFFPNTPDPSAGQETPGQRLSPIDRARAQYERGNTEAALTSLKKLPPSSPHYEEAQALIAQWEGAQQPDDGDGPEIDPAVQARHDALAAAARTAVSEGRMLEARALFRAAGETLALSPADSQRLFDTEEKARSLSEEIKLFERNEWEEALRMLWRRHLDEPDDPDIKLLIAYSYYNIGVQSLQRGNLNSAEQSFTELLDVDPDDADARRHLLFAQTYLQRDADLLYRIYVKYLPFRTVP